MLLPIATFLCAHLFAAPNGWTLEGKARLHGVDEIFNFATDGGLRFRFEASGPLPDTNAYDGSRLWVLGESGVPHYEDRQGKDADELVAWVLDGEWNAPGAPVQRVPAGDGTIHLTCNGGAGLNATLTLDPQTKAPASLSYWEVDGTTTWSFSSYKRFGDRSFPTQIECEVGKEHESYTVERAEPATVEDTEFRLPNVSEDGATFDPAVASAIEVKHLFGYFFVHPLVDGKDVGWFFLDTGAGAMVLDIEAAKGLSVKPVGSRTVAGVVATIQTPIVRGSEFKLGPVSIAHPTFLELDVSSIGRMFNLKLGGICGYDFISRASLEIDARTPSIKVFPPGKAVLPASSSWTGFDFTANLMCLKCRFEGGHEGYFTLDTGSGSAVDFTAPTVEKFDLLKDRQTTPTRVGGAGGVTAAKQGRLDWIEVAGNRVANVLAGFQTTKAGVYASPYLAGNLGAGVLGRFDLLLDYRNQRLALVPFAPAKATATGG